MPTTAERLSQLVADSFDWAFTDVHVSSMDALRFLELVNDEFDLGLSAQDRLKLKNRGDLEGFIDARAGYAVLVIMDLSET